MKHYHTIIFDLDGTLLNTIEDLADSLNHTLTEYGLPSRTLMEVQNSVGNGLQKLLERSIAEGLNHPQFKEIFDSFKSYYILHCKEKTLPYPGIIDLLKELHYRNIPMAIVSNKNDKAVKQLASDFFDGIIPVAIGERDGISKKPAPDTVFAALEELGQNTENVVYIGDSEVDLQTAANSGIDCISVSWGFRGRTFLENLGAETIIDTPQEILYFLI